MGLFDFLTTVAEEAIEVIPTISEEKANEALGKLENMNTADLKERLDKGEIDEDFIDDLVDNITAFAGAIEIIECYSEEE